MFAVRPNRAGRLGVSGAHRYFCQFRAIGRARPGDHVRTVGISGGSVESESSSCRRARCDVLRDKIVIQAPSDSSFAHAKAGNSARLDDGMLVAVTAMTERVFAGQRTFAWGWFR